MCLSRITGKRKESTIELLSRSSLVVLWPVSAKRDMPSSATLAQLFRSASKMLLGLARRKVMTYGFEICHDVHFDSKDSERHGMVTVILIGKGCIFLQLPNKHRLDSCPLLLRISEQQLSAFLNGRGVEFHQSRRPELVW